MFIGSSWDSDYVTNARDCVFSTKIKKHLSKLFPLDFHRSHRLVQDKLERNSVVFTEKVVPFLEQKCYMANLQLKKQQILNQTAALKEKGKKDWKILFDYVIVSYQFLSEYELHSDFCAQLMGSQLKTNIKFHPEFMKLSASQKRNSINKENLNIGGEPDETSVKVQELITFKTGKYELLFDGFYPLLEIDLNEEFLEKLFSKRQKLVEEGNLWEVESHRIVKMLVNCYSLYGKQGFGSKTLINSRVQFDCDGYLLEKVKISQTKFILTNSHLM